MTLSTDLAERIEIEAYADFASAAPGLSTRGFGPALAFAVPDDPTGFWCKAGGFDTVAHLADVCDFFQSTGVATADLAIAPDRLPADWPDLVAGLGLEEGERKVKMAAEVDQVTARSTLDPALRVAPVERQDAEQWARVMMTTFEMPDMAGMAAAAIGRPNWHAYAVWEGTEIVAVASAFSHAGATNMFGGATVPKARARGAQSALLAARARVARQEDMLWLVAETEADQHNPSLRNLYRAGFHPLYERTTWHWRRR
jgi:GNAT superfamily N-acetyltransferase